MIRLVWYQIAAGDQLMTFNGCIIMDGPLIRSKNAREIKGQPGLLRVIVAFLRRLQWLFFVTLLGIAYLATSVAAWPASNYLIYSAMLLSGAWLLITLVSHVIRRRIIGRAFAIATWIYVAMVILGITDDAAAILDRAAFDIGTFRISILGVIEATVFLGVLLLISLNVGNFLDRRIQRIDELTPSLRVLIGKILRIVIILLAFLVAMSGLGIDLTALTVLSGAVGVGGWWAHDAKNSKNSYPLNGSNGNPLAFRAIWPSSTMLRWPTGTLALTEKYSTMYKITH